MWNIEHFRFQTKILKFWRKKTDEFLIYRTHLCFGNIRKLTIYVYASRLILKSELNGDNQKDPKILQMVGLIWFSVFNATFNNISFILQQSVLLMEEIRVPGENHRPVASQ